MKKSQNIRILLTAAVLLVGGYYIQKSTSSNPVLMNITENAHADVPATGPIK